MGSEALETVVVFMGGGFGFLFLLRPSAGRGRPEEDEEEINLGIYYSPAQLIISVWEIIKRK